MKTVPIPFNLFSLIVMDEQQPLKLRKSISIRWNLEKSTDIELRSSFQTSSLWLVALIEREMERKRFQ